MEKPVLEAALVKLGAQFEARHWSYLKVPPESPRQRSYAWPGDPEESIMICVHKGPDIQEEFHRQDFFFFNFAYLGDYGALSFKSDNRITVHENECYIGQPFTGYALSAHSLNDIIIIGILIQKETFLRVFLPVLSADERLLHFFLDPQSNEFSQDFIHLRFEEPGSIRTLLELMVIEYAKAQEYTQEILQSLVLTLLLKTARQYQRSRPLPESERLADRMVCYIGEHSDSVSLKSMARHFGCHPNYISALLSREIGKSFSELLLEQRMERAVILLKGTKLSVEEIAAILGYSNSSNFYKAFRGRFKKSPREYAGAKG